jgi:hypothetical protein
VIFLPGYADERSGTAVEKVLGLHDRFPAGCSEAEVDAKIPAGSETLHAQVQFGLEEVAH